MRFSHLLSQLPAVEEASPRDLAADPEIGGAESLERAGADQLSFLEAGHASAAALDSTAAGALLLFPDPDLQARASARGLAWVAVPNPRLAFAEALEALFPRRRPQPGAHATAVISPEARVAPEAIGRAADLRHKEPGAAAQQPEFLITNHPSPPIRWSALVAVVPTVQTPFPHISVHVQ